MKTSSKLEALLFAEAQPMRISSAARFLDTPEEEIRAAARELHQELEGRGIRLVQTDDKMALGTAPEMSRIIEKWRAEELKKDLGKAGVETLAIICYRDPITKPHIDYIRGVNSSFVLRTLLVRGLIQRTAKPDEKRTFMYQPTLDALRYLGVSKAEELPEYDQIQNEIESFESRYADTEAHEAS